MSVSRAPVFVRYVAIVAALSAAAVQVTTVAAATVQVQPLSTAVFMNNLAKGRSPLHLARVSNLTDVASSRLRPVNSSASSDTLRGVWLKRVAASAYDLEFLSLADIPSTNTQHKVLFNTTSAPGSWQSLLAIEGSPGYCWFTSQWRSAQVTFHIQHVHSGGQVSGYFTAAAATVAKALGLQHLSLNLTEWYDNGMVEYIIAATVTPENASEADTVAPHMHFTVYWTDSNAVLNTMHGLFLQYLSMLPGFSCAAPTAVFAGHLRVNVADISPSTIDYAAAPGTLQVFGEGFSPNASLLVDGVLLPTHTITDSSLIVSFDSPLSLGWQEVRLVDEMFGEIQILNYLYVGVTGYRTFLLGFRNELRAIMENGTLVGPFASTASDLPHWEESQLRFVLDFPSLPQSLVYEVPYSLTPSGVLSMGGWYFLDNWYTGVARSMTLLSLYYDTLGASLKITNTLSALTVTAKVGTSSVTFTDSCLSSCEFNGWHHVFLVFDGTSVKVFMDGVERNSATASATLGTTASSTCIAVGGAVNAADCTLDTAGTTFPSASVADVRVYNRVLDATGIGHMMNE